MLGTKGKTPSGLAPDGVSMVAGRKLCRGCVQVESYHGYTRKQGRPRTGSRRDFLKLGLLRALPAPCGHVREVTDHQLDLAVGRPIRSHCSLRIVAARLGRKVTVYRRLFLLVFLIGRSAQHQALG